MKLTEQIDVGGILLSLGAEYNEITGYNLFNTDDGSNIICDIDPTCRKLTEPEKKFLSDYFGDQVDYNLINIIQRKRLGIGSYSGAAIGNTIFLPRGLEASADDLEALSLKTVFMHEATHVWQYQNTPFLEYLNAAVFDNDYGYDIEDFDNLSSFGIEQQASIVMNIFLKREVYKSPELARQVFDLPDWSEEDFLKMLENSCPDDLHPHEKVASTSLPNISLTECPSY